MRRQSDQWRESSVGYCEQWGWRGKSGVGQLINFLREEHRAKYHTDYRLIRIGENRFKAIAGDHGDYGVSYAVEYASQFGTHVETEVCNESSG